RPGRIDLGQPGAGQATAESRVEMLRPGGEKAARGHAAMADEVDILGLPVEAPIKSLGQAAFDLRDLMAQGHNGLPRHGRRGHDVCSSEICSCYVPIDSRADQRSQAESKKNLFLAG